MRIRTLATGPLSWLAYGVIRLLGRRHALRIARSPLFARALVWLVNTIFSKKNHCFARNLRLVFPGIDDARIASVRREAFANMARMAVETICLSARDLPEITFTGVDNLRAAGDSGVIFVTGHVNNLYYIPLCTDSLGYRCAFMRLAMQDPMLETLSHRIIAPHCVDVPHEEARRFAELVRDGSNVLIVPDLRVKGGRNGVQLPFCGHPAWTSTYIAELAIAHARPIVPTYILRHPGDRLEIVFEPAIDTRSGDKAVVQTRINDSIGARVMAEPASWTLWNSNRWGR